MILNYEEKLTTVRKLFEGKLNPLDYPPTNWLVKGYNAIVNRTCPISLCIVVLCFILF